LRILFGVTDPNFNALLFAFRKSLPEKRVDGSGGGTYISADSGLGSLLGRYKRLTSLAAPQPYGSTMPIKGFLPVVGNVKGCVSRRRRRVFGVLYCSGSFSKS
jgi:hypothetical protein